MPRGQHPNSKKALEENRPQFNTETAVKAARASVEAHKAKRRLREELEILLDAEKAGKTMRERIAVALIDKAAKGDVRAAEFVRDTVEGKPTNQIAIQAPEPIVIAGYDEVLD